MSDEAWRRYDAQSERVAETLAWARSRIAECRRRCEDPSTSALAVIEVSTERRALEAVVRMLTEEQ